MSDPALMQTALEALLEHAKPSNLAELREAAPDQFAAWQLGELALAQARAGDSAPIVVTVNFDLMRDLVGKLRASCA